MSAEKTDLRPLTKLIRIIVQTFQNTFSLHSFNAFVELSSSEYKIKLF
jgi:hypothetical protein